MKVVVDGGVAEFLCIADDSVEITFWRGEEVGIVHENSSWKVIPAPYAVVDEGTGECHPRRTCEEFECSRDAPPLWNIKDISFLQHVQTRINNNRLRSMKLLPTNVAGMIDKIEIPRQVGEGVQQIVLRDEGVIGGAEIDEPVPIATLSEEDGRGVEGVGDHGGAAVGDKIGFCDHLNIADGGEDGVADDEVVEVLALVEGGLEVEVDDVAVGGMV